MDDFYSPVAEFYDLVGVHTLPVNRPYVNVSPQ